MAWLSTGNWESIGKLKISVSISISNLRHAINLWLPYSNHEPYNTFGCNVFSLLFFKLVTLKQRVVFHDYKVPGLLVNVVHVGS